MEINELRDYIEICDSMISLSQEYCNLKKKSAKAETDLKIILTSKLRQIREVKSNVGLDMALLMLLETDDDGTLKAIYREWKENEGICDGLKKLIDAKNSKIIYIESILKYEKENT